MIRLAILTPQEQAQLQQCQSDPRGREVLEQLRRVLVSQRFARVQKADELLTYVVAQALLGCADRIKESTIASAVYGKSDFDPLIDTTVRVAAKDLRNRLDDYYAGEGEDDPFEILIPVGTYVPEFRDRRILIEVRQVDCWHPQRDHDDLCPVLTDAITYWLTRSVRVRASRVSAFSHPAAPGVYSLRTSLEIASDGLKINVSVGDLCDGCSVLSKSCRSAREAPFELARQVADMTRVAIQHAERQRYGMAIVSRKRSDKR